MQDYLSRRSPSIEPLTYNNPTTFGLLSVASNDGASPALRQQIGQVLATWARGQVTTIRSPINPWAVSLSSYHWASNKTALDNAVVLLIANKFAPGDGYTSAAADQLHYVLGRNANAKSYVTGYGTNSVKNPHNRVMFSLGRLVPGVLVGGPNGEGQDGITPVSQGQRSYLDDLKAYASNENSVEYNAPLVVVASILSS